MNNTNSISVNKVLAITIVLTLGWMTYMRMAVMPFTSKQIVEFELAKTPEAASQLLIEWQEKNLIAKAKKSIHLDFVFLVLYSFAIALASLAVSDFTGNRFLIQMGLWLSRIVMVAGLSDVVENLAMLRTISGLMNDRTTAIAYWFAVIKFSIIILSLLFIVGCFVFGGVKRLFAIIIRS
jgi:hypothetical protein